MERGLRFAIITRAIGGEVPCSMSGEPQASGICACDPGFTGANCSSLRFGLPEIADAGLNYSFGPDIDGGKDQWTWGGSPVQDDNGTYHMFFSWFRFGNHTPHTIKNWYNSSVVAHATSDRPGGGFVYKDVILAPRGGGLFDGTTTHNPTVTRLPDGSFALYYIGLNCANYTGLDCIKHQWIGAAHATHPNGPWERLPEPVLSGEDGQKWEGGMVANPSVMALKNGTLLMAYRGLGDRGIGMATAPSWKGPFTRLNGGAPVMGPDSPMKSAVDEDMTLWQTERGIQMIFHQEGRDENVGAHAYSTDDGLSWTVAGDAYSLSVAFAKGVTTYTRRERPQMLKNKDGLPTHMFSGVQDNSTGFTHTIVVSLDLETSRSSVLV